MLIANQLIGFGVAETALPRLAAHTDTFSIVGSGVNTSLLIGAADPARYIALLMWARGTSPTFNVVTVGGIACSPFISAVSNNNRAAIYVSDAPVPTGTSATVVVTSAGSIARMGLSVVALYNLTDPTVPIDPKSSSADPAALSLNVAQGDLILGVAGGSTGSGNPTWTWTGLDEDVDAVISVQVAYSTAHGQAEVAASPRTVEANQTAAITSGLLQAAAVAIR